MQKHRPNAQATAGAIARTAASRSATPSLATPAEMWRRTVIGDSDRTWPISKHTVKQYVANLFEKLGVSSRVQAAVYAVRKGLV